MNSNWGHLHSHSHYSNQDSLSSVPAMVAKVKKMKQPFLGLTDHGLLSGTVQLYKECKANDILPYPGFEGYLIQPDLDESDENYWSAKTKRFHFGLIARNLTGYKAIVRLLSLCYTKPRVIGQGAKVFPRTTYDDLEALGLAHGNDVILTTGCYFGYLQQTLVNLGEREAYHVVLALKQRFPHLVVELQHHNIGAQVPGWGDDEIIDALVHMADLTDSMVMATQDSHYLDQKDKPAHTLMKKMIYEQDEFPGETFHLSTTDFVKEHYSSKVWNRVEDTSKTLLDLHELVIPPLDSYKVRIPTMPTRNVPTPTGRPWPMTADAYLRELVLDAFGNFMYEGKWDKKDNKKYADRIEEELSVIKDMGLADYFLLVLLVIQYCNDNEICVECRGSGNSSLIGYVLGITQVDPIRWGLFFERFLSRDRIKPPDYDLDIETDRRQEVVDFINTLCETLRIGTFAILGSRPDEPERGNALVTYLQYLRKKCEKEALEIEPAKGKALELAKQIFQKKYSYITGISDVASVSKSDYSALHKLIKAKTYRGYGAHAGGVLLGTKEIAISDYIPQMQIMSSKTMVTQYTMDDLEAFGLVKLDLLGQDSLSVMKKCCELLLKSNTNDFSWIPEDDKQAMEVMREGRPDNGIYHF